jgi:hypothetical protein
MFYASEDPAAAEAAEELVSGCGFVPARIGGWAEVRLMEAHDATGLFTARPTDRTMRAGSPRPRRSTSIVPQRSRPSCGSRTDGDAHRRQVGALRAPSLVKSLRPMAAERERVGAHI